MNSLLWWSRTSGFYTRLGLGFVGVVFICVCSPNVRAQTLSFFGPHPAVDFGTANLCKPGAATPSPCSQTITLTYKITEGGTLGIPRVLTEGSSNLDFELADGSTCKGTVSSETTCTVNVKFAPVTPGKRPGGVKIIDEKGNVLATTLIYGTAYGPQIGFTPGIVTKLNYPHSTINVANMVADGAGNLFVVTSGIQELPADGSSPIAIPIAPAADVATLAIDGAGDLIFLNSVGVWRLADGGPATLLPLFSDGQAVLVGVDAGGDVFAFASGSENQEEVPAVAFELHAGSDRVTEATFFYPNLFALDLSGNLFGSRSYSSAEVLEFPHGSETSKTLPFLVDDSYESLEDVSVDSVGNVFAREYVYASPSGFMTPYYTYFELPVGGHAQINVPLPENPTLLTKGPAGDLFVSAGSDDDHLRLLERVHRSNALPLNFGSVRVGSTKTLPLAITNTGNKNLILSPYLESASYKILSEQPTGCLGGVDPGHTCSVNIQFTALSEGPHTITLTLGSNGASDSNVLLEGIGKE